MSPQHGEEQEFSFKSLFVPLTTLKAIHWIIIIGLIVYANSFFNGFVWDDITYIRDNPQVHSVNLVSFFKGNLFNTKINYRPIPATYFSLVYSMVGNTTFLYHFLQVMMHIINCALIFLLFKKFFRVKLALFLSLLFLVHPIQVESTAFISATVSPLFFLFGMAALYLCLQSKITLKRVILIFILILLSLLTKETGILFVFLILAYRTFFETKNKVSFYLGTIITIIFYLVIRLGVGDVTFTQLEFTPISKLTLAQRIINIPAVVFYYIKTIFYPAQLAINQVWVNTQIDLINFYFPLIFDVLFFSCIIFLGVYIFKTQKKIIQLFSFFCLWFVIGLGMHVQIIPLDMTVADRWFYFPLVGLLGLIGIGVNNLTCSKKLIQVGYLAGIVILLLLSGRTIVRNTNWSNAITLYTHDSMVSDNFYLENNLGSQYIDQGNYSQAAIHLSKAVIMSPNEVTMYNLGLAYEHMGEFDKAKEFYVKALNQGANKSLENFYSYERLSFVLSLRGEYKEAVDILNHGLQKYPDQGRLWFALAVVQHTLHHGNEALIAAQKAKSLYPGTQTDDIYTRIVNKQ